ILDRLCELLVRLSVLCWDLNHQGLQMTFTEELSVLKVVRCIELSKIIFHVDGPRQLRLISVRELDRAGELHVEERTQPGRTQGKDFLVARGQQNYRGLGCQDSPIIPIAKILAGVFV